MAFGHSRHTHWASEFSFLLPSLCQFRVAAFRVLLEIVMLTIPVSGHRKSSWQIDVGFVPQTVPGLLNTERPVLPEPVYSPPKQWRLDAKRRA